jgi:NAD+-dependent protein deacetylase sirtuin 5
MASEARPSDPWALFAQHLASCRKILCLVGAGLSAPSGIRTWRGTCGLWTNMNVRDLATLRAFERDPVLVWKFYGERILEVLAAKPNPAHYALTEFAKRHESFLTVNQNIDGKRHERELGLCY